jgi:hypothetical protein
MTVFAVLLKIICMALILSLMALYGSQIEYVYWYLVAGCRGAFL